MSHSSLLFSIMPLASGGGGGGGPTPPDDPTGLWRGSYTGDPWLPTPSSGTSGSHGNLITNPDTAGGTATVGSAVNTFTPAHTDSSHESFIGTATTADLIGTGAEFTIVILAKADVHTATPGAYYNITGLFTEAFGDMALGIASTGIVAGVWDGGQKQTSPIAINDDVWFMAVMRYKEVASVGTLECRVNTTDATPITTNSFVDQGVDTTFLVGTNYSSSRSFEGDIMVVETFDRRLEDSELDDTFADFQATYPAMGLTDLPPAAPTITSVVPNSGQNTGGRFIKIFISGSSAGITGATVGGLALDNLATGSGFVSGNVPAHANGLVSVTVTNAGGTGTQTNAFTYTTPTVVTFGSPPIVANATNFPAGLSAGGDAVTILVNSTEGVTSVDFGLGAPMTSLVIVNSTTITGITPAQVSGDVAVTVTNNVGTSAAAGPGFSGLPDSFRYVTSAPSAPISVSPSIGTDVGVGPTYGTGFTVQVDSSTDLIRIAYIAAGSPISLTSNHEIWLNFAIVDPTHVFGNINGLPPSDTYTGLTDVYVFNGVWSPALSNAITKASALFINTVSPQSGSAHSFTSLNGSGFLGSAVRCGLDFASSVAAENVIISDDNTISLRIPATFTSGTSPNIYVISQYGPAWPDPAAVFTNNFFDVL